MNNVAGKIEVPLTVFSGLNQELGPTDLPSGLSPDCSDVAFLPGQVFTRPSLQRFDTLGTTSQVIYASAYTKPDGTVVQLRFTADGKIYANGVQIGTTKAGNRFKTWAAFGKMFIATSDALHGADVPLQYTAEGYLDRVSQDGPGAAPAFSATTIAGDSYPISSITQPAVGGGAGPRTSSYLLQSNGPGSTAAGTTVTVYYSDLTRGSADADLVNAVNSYLAGGPPVYLYFSFTGNPNPVSPTTIKVTSVGSAMPPGQPRSFAYFTYTTNTTASIDDSGSSHPGYTATYQRTLATLTTTIPVPGLIVGGTATVSDTSVPAYNTNWPIEQTLNSGDMAITQTSLMGGTATFQYTLNTGIAPIAGQQVTVAGTLNANGTLNGTKNPDGTITPFTIATATGGSSGSFTVTGFGSTNYPSVAENGDAETAGTIFTFDPGAVTLNTTNSPIYGNATGGQLTFIGQQSFIAPGVRQGVVFFITRTGYLTIPSPSATFDIPANVNAIEVSNLPIGPANVIARGVAFTGADGGSFFYLPVAAQLNGVTYGTSTVVEDNTSSTATFSFTDQSLLAATGIDIPGNNLFRQVVLGTVLGFYAYASRLFAWGERNKIQQFLNMGFEGGVLAGSSNPLGWSASGSGQVIVGGDYGAAWRVTGSGSGMDGLLTQSAYQDSFDIPILLPNTQYTFRLWASGSGSPVAEFYSPSLGVLAKATVTTNGNFAEAVFSALTPATIPTDTVLRVYASGLATGQTLDMDEMEFYYTANPYLRVARGSYVNNPEAFDGVTGLIGPANDPNEIRTMFEHRDTLNFLTAGPFGSLYETADTASGECSTWNIEHRESKCGALSVWGDTQFEDWQVWASDTGLRIYDGGNVEKLSQEVQDFWNSLNPAQTQLTVVANDPYTRRVYISSVTGTAVVNNSMFVMDYRELNTEAAIANAGTLHVGYTGKVVTTDLTRKWAPWTVKANWCGVLGTGADAVMMFCGGDGLQLSNPLNSATYTLSEDVISGVDDDYGPFWDTSYYSTYFFVAADEAQQKQLGIHRLIHGPLLENVTGVGLRYIEAHVGSIGNVIQTTRGIPIAPNLSADRIYSFSVAGDRISYRLRSRPATDGTQAGFRSSLLTVAMKTHPYSGISGWNKNA